MRNNKSVLKILTIAMVLMISVFSVNAQTIHTIICGATNVNDIGAGCKASVKLMEDAIEYVGSQTGMKTEFTRCLGNNFNKEKIAEAIRKVNPKENDVVFFYSTSHGFNYNNNISKFTFIGAHPTKVEMTRSEFENFGMSLEKEIYEPLLAKGARLTIAMSEACNTVVDIPAPTRYHAMNVNIPKRLKELFLEAKGSAVSSSSRLDQRSWTDPKDGGIYTNMFIESLNESISSSKKAHWDDVFNKTESMTVAYANNEGIRGGQRPQTDTYFYDTPLQLKEEGEDKKETKKKSKKGTYYAPKLRVIDEK